MDDNIPSTQASEETITVLLPNVAKSEILADLFSLYTRPDSAGYLDSLLNLTQEAVVALGEDAKEEVRVRKGTKRRYSRGTLLGLLLSSREFRVNCRKRQRKSVHRAALLSPKVEMRSDEDEENVVGYEQRQPKRPRPSEPLAVASLTIRKLGEPCLDCGESFSTDRELEDHFVSSGHNKTFKCSVCGKTYKTKVSLEDHCVTAHRVAGSEISWKQCHVCKKRFTKKKEFYAHKLMHQPEKWRFSCDVCGEKAMTTRLLNAHKVN